MLTVGFDTSRENHAGLLNQRSIFETNSATLCLSGKFYDIAPGLTNLAPTIAAINMKSATVKPPHMPANENEAASPFRPTSSFPKTFCEPS